MAIADPSDVFVTGAATESAIAKGPPPSDSQEAKAASEATAIEVLGNRDETLFQLSMTRGVTVEVYTLSNPYRVIIDLPDVQFQQTASSGTEARGLIREFRYGQFDAGRARIVLDTNGPVSINKAAMTNARGGGGVVLTVGLKPTDAAAFGAGTGGGRQQEAASTGPGPEHVPEKSESAKPVIVIDPGHGGIDPGAVGAANLLEKKIVLTVAMRLRERLERTGRYSVVMTRDRDVFISLSDRLAISRKVQSDLFISLHADSIEETYAQSINGATVYTLSERASDAAARAMAEKENASDLVAGLDVGQGEENSDVKNILIDLMKRETANFSAEFSRTLVRQLKTNVGLSRDPERAAAFKVLRQTHAPSVLVELGYISNPDESRRMQTTTWQNNMATSLAAAVDAYFTSRIARQPE